MPTPKPTSRFIVALWIFLVFIAIASVYLSIHKKREAIDQHWHILSNASNSTDIERIKAIDGLIVAGEDLSQVKLPSLNLENKQLQGLNLSGIDLRTSIFSNANLTEADLSGSIFIKAHLREVVFDKAQLTGSNLSYSELEGSTFIGSTLNSTMFKGAHMQGVDFSRADMKDAWLYLGYAQDATFLGSNLKNSTLIGVDFEGANFQNSTLDKSSLALSNLQGTNFKNASLIATDINNNFLYEITFEGANLEKANLSKTISYQVNFTNANLKGTDFSNSFLHQIDFSGSDLSGNRFEETSLQKANFEQANLELARFTNADLRHSNLNNTNLTYAVLVQTDLSHASLMGADTTNANLRSAILNNTAFLPSDSLLHLSNAQRKSIIIKDFEGNIYDSTSTHDIDGKPLSQTSWKIKTKDTQYSQASKANTDIEQPQEPILFLMSPSKLWYLLEPSSRFYDSVSSAFNDALKIELGEIKLDHPDAPAIINEFALIYGRAAELDHAETLFKQALALSQQATVPNLTEEARSHKYLGELYTLQERDALAKEHSAQAEVLLQQLGVEVDSEKALSPVE